MMMKIVIHGTAIAAVVLPSYEPTGAETAIIDAPPDLDIARLHEYVYDALTGTVALNNGRRVTRLAFRNRFAQAEKIGLEIASLDDAAAGMPARQQAAALRAYLADVAAASFIDLNRLDTRAGVQLLETMGLLAEGRALAILDTPVAPEERPLP